MINLVKNHLPLLRLLKALNRTVKEKEKNPLENQKRETY